MNHTLILNGYEHYREVAKNYVNGIEWSFEKHYLTN